ncbi:hypothetical protein P4483_27140 [Bacillus thuringiensis]|nr:hypothetical protein [Bacillus thuringiensis]
MSDQAKVKEIVTDILELNSKIKSLKPVERRMLTNLLENKIDDSDLNGGLVYTYENINSSKKKHQVEDFSFGTIMSKLRYAILNDFKETDNLSEIDWLLKIMLQSRTLFKTTKEADIFLSNITGFIHNTKSTGRDRIVDWYFNRIKELDLKEQNIIYFRISKYLFINIPSNYKEWKNILFKGGK